MGAPAPPRPRPPPAPSAPLPTGPSVRAAGVFLVLLLLFAGLAYPGALTELATIETPGTAGGSLLHAPNGTVWGSALIGENITNPAMFWLRPSEIDDQAFLGAGSEVPPGPTDPALLNETDYYIAQEGLNNTTVPIDLVTPSASGLDPDLTPAAVLVQVPRVAHYSGLSEAFLTGLVNAHIHHPDAGVFGTSWVNVVELDVDLLADLPPGTNPGAPS
jgi:potassium-transporting ATPase KdpC subunit